MRACHELDMGPFSDRYELTPSILDKRNSPLNTLVLTPSEKDIARAGAILCAGGVVALPTETV